MYKDVFDKFEKNRTEIDLWRDKYRSGIFSMVFDVCLESGRKFYSVSKDIFSDKDFLMLRYFVMNTLVYPLTDTTEHKFDLISDFDTNAGNAFSHFDNVGAKNRNNYNLSFLDIFHSIKSLYSLSTIKKNNGIGIQR